MNSIYGNTSSAFSVLRSALCSRPTAFFIHKCEYSVATAEERLGLKRPKKPTPPFLRFTSQIRPSLLAQNPGVRITGIMKIAGEHWKEVEDKVKQKLTADYEKDKVEYNKNLEKYLSSLTPEQIHDIKEMKENMAISKEKRKHKLECKQLGRPKRPMSSFFIYAAEERKKLSPSLSLLEAQKECAKKWKTLNDTERAVWTAKASACKEVFRKQMAEWEEKMVRTGNIDLVRNQLLIDASSRKKKSPAPE